MNANKEILECSCDLKLNSLQNLLHDHFLFNTLTTLQHFIALDHREEADTYLSTFGHLIRKYIRISKSISISLKHEIEILNEYIALEEKRHNYPIQLEIENDLDFQDLEEIQIPTMILQFFVEHLIRTETKNTNNDILYLHLNMSKPDNSYYRFVMKTDGKANSVTESIYPPAQNFKKRIDERFDLINQSELYKMNYELKKGPKQSQIIFNFQNNSKCTHAL